MHIMNSNILFTTSLRIAACALASIVSFSTASAQTASGQAPQGPARATPAPASDQDVIRVQLPSYPVKTCVVSGEPLGKDGPIVDQVVQGRLVRMCCRECAKEIAKDPAPALRKLDAAVVAAQKPSYPLATCPVTGEKLGDKAVDHVYGTRLVRLANADAVASFDKDPKTAMQKVDRAWIEAQIPTYSQKVCPVTHEALGGEMGDPIDYLHGTKLVRFCCKACVRKFEKDPDKYLAAAK